MQIYLKINGICLILIFFVLACSSQEVRTGVFVSDSASAFPLPTSGYRVYFVGEEHGVVETKSIFMVYLKRLYEEAGLRDVILEEDQVYEPDANAYILGKSGTLRDELCLRKDLLSLIREFNENQPDNNKVQVHLVDVDSPLSAILIHLQSIREEIGANASSIKIPPLAEFETWSPAQMMALLNTLETAAAGDSNALNQLQTARSSIRWYLHGNRLEIGQPEGSRRLFAPIREDVIEQNVHYVLESAGEKPVLVFFGWAHGMKIMADPNPPQKGFTSWVQRLSESGVPVFSLELTALSGDSFWRGEPFHYPEGSESILMPDGTSVGQILTDSGKQMLYIDFRTGDNSTAKMPSNLKNTPAGELFDAQIMFKSVTPMQDLCK